MKAVLRIAYPIIARDNRMGQPLRPQRITAEVDAMHDKFVEATLARLKDLYDSGVISEAFYYRTQCKIFRAIHNEPSVHQAPQKASDKEEQYSEDPAKKVRISRVFAPHYASLKGKV